MYSTLKRYVEPAEPALGKVVKKKRRKMKKKKKIKKKNSRKKLRSHVFGEP